MVLGASGQGAEIADWLTARGTVGLCAMQAGVAGRALELTAEYARSREQFGRPIGSFQAVAQRLADAYIDVEAVRLTMWQAAWLLASGRLRRRRGRRRGRHRQVLGRRRGPPGGAHRRPRARRHGHRHVLPGAPLLHRGQARRVHPRRRHGTATAGSATSSRRRMAKRIAGVRSPGSAPLGGELLLGEDALVLEGGELLDLFDLRGLGGFGCGRFIRLDQGQAGQPGPGRPRRSLPDWLHVAAVRPRPRWSLIVHGSASSHRHVNRLLLSWRRRRRAVRREWCGLADLSVESVGQGAHGLFDDLARDSCAFEDYPSALRTAAANGPAQVSSQMSSAAEEFGSRL